MTMAVGFLCRDGVVIGADRQVTNQASGYTFPECKIVSFKWGNGHGILAYAGSRDTFMILSREIGLRISDDPILHDSETRQLLIDSVKASAGKKEQFCTLFGYWLDAENSPRLVMSVPGLRLVDVPECEVIGYGDSPLSRFLLGRFRDVPHLVTVPQARIYAVAFIAEAKKYDGEFVGGPIDVYSIDMSGQNGERSVRVLDAGQTGNWEEQIGLMAYKTDVAFSYLTDKTVPIEEAIKLYTEAVKRFRSWMG